MFFLTVHVMDVVFGRPDAVLLDCATCSYTLRLRVSELSFLSELVSEGGNESMSDQ